MMSCEDLNCGFTDLVNNDSAMVTFLKTLCWELPTLPTGNFSIKTHRMSLLLNFSHDQNNLALD